MRSRREERLESQLRAAHGLGDDLAVEAAAVDDAELRALQAHVVDDALRRALAQRELVALAADLADELDEGVDHEGVVLARDGEDAAHRRVADVAALEQVGLLDDLAGVAEEARALLGERDASRRAVEDRDAHLGLELAHGLREARLRDEEALGRLGDRPRVGDLDGVPELRERHVLLPTCEISLSDFAAFSACLE